MFLLEKMFFVLSVFFFMAIGFVTCVEFEGLEKTVNLTLQSDTDVQCLNATDSVPKLGLYLAGIRVDIPSDYNGSVVASVNKSLLCDEGVVTGNNTGTFTFDRTDSRFCTIQATYDLILGLQICVNASSPKSIVVEWHNLVPWFHYNYDDHTFYRVTRPSNLGIVHPDGCFMPSNHLMQIEQTTSTSADVNKMFRLSFHTEEKNDRFAFLCGGSNTTHWLWRCPPYEGVAFYDIERNISLGYTNWATGAQVWNLTNACLVINQSGDWNSTRECNRTKTSRCAVRANLTKAKVNGRYAHYGRINITVSVNNTLPAVFPSTTFSSSPATTTLERIAHGTATGTAAISFIGQSVSISSLLQPMVSNAFTAIMQCGEYLPPDFFAHPVQVRIGGGLFGPCIGVVTFDLAFAVANLILYTMVRGWARFPGAGLITWIFFYQPVSQYAARLALMAEGSLRAYGALVLAAQSAVCVGSFVVDNKSKRFKTIFSPYAEGRAWFVTAELGMQLALSMISGYVSPHADGCKVQAWLLAVVLVAHGTVLVFFKVLLNAFETWFVTLVKILYLVCILLITFEKTEAAKALLTFVDFLMATFNIMCLVRDIVVFVRNKNARDTRGKQVDSAMSARASLDDETIDELSAEMTSRLSPSAHDGHRASKEVAQTQSVSVHDGHRALKEVSQTMSSSKGKPKFEL